VALARSGPVGNPPLVALTDSVRFGVVPVQPLQKRLMSALTSCPERPALNVCPSHVVDVKPKPLVPRLVFD
jgi:hypothetical protein